MGARQRALAALNHEESDRVPIWTLVDNASVLRHFATEEADFEGLGAGEVSLEFTPVNWDPLVRLQLDASKALGIDVMFLCEGGPINPFTRERNEMKSKSTWETTYHALDEVASYTPKIPDYDEVAKNYVPFMRKAVEMAGEDVMIVDQQGTCLELAWSALGLPTFCMAMYDMPKEVSRILDAAAEACRVPAQVYADYKLSFAYQVSGDIAFKGTTMFSPDFLRREYVPRLARQLEPLKQAGIKVVYHSDGDVTAIIDGLIEAGVDGLNPIEPTSGMDLAAIKKRYGKNLVLVGNVDANVMTLGTPQDVEREVKRCIRDAGRGGGLFIDTGAGELMPWYPLENVVAMCEAVHRFGQYPISL
jgi:uroporphyrinogen-III decarboxylase